MKDVETKLNSLTLNSTQYNNSLVSNVSMKAQPVQNTVPQVQLPDIYYNPNADYKKKSFLDIIKTFDITGFTASIFEHPLGVLGTWFALSFGMDKFNGACRGEYDKSFIGKAANFGDKIANLKPFKSDTFKKASSGIAKGWNKLITKSKEKSGVVRAFIDTPAKPEWKSAKSIMFNEKAELVGDLTHILNLLKIEPGQDAVGLSQECMNFRNIDIRKNEIHEIEKFFGNKLKDIKSEELCNYVNLKHIGTDEQTIKKILASSNSSIETKQEIMKKMGIELKDILEWQKEPEKYFEQAKKAAEKVRGISVQAGNSKISGKLFARNLGVDGIHNKMLSITKDGGKTALGRFNAKAIQRIYRGITFGNGKLGALFWVTPMLLHALKDTKEAGRDEKVGTAAWGLIDSFLWIITFGLSAKLLYHTAGIRNAGMKKETVQEIENIKNTFNKNFLEGKFNTKQAAIDARKKAAEKITKLRNVEGQNLLTRILRKVVTPLSKDLNMMKGVTFWQRLGNKAQNCVSVPLKFALVLFVFDSKMRDFAKKCCNAVFGKNYDSQATEEHNAEKERQKEFTKKDLTQRLYKTQVAKVAAQNKPVINNDAIAEQEDNLQKTAIAPLPVELKSKDELNQKIAQPQVMQNEFAKQELQQPQVVQDKTTEQKIVEEKPEKQVYNTEQISQETETQKVVNPEINKEEPVIRNNEQVEPIPQENNVVQNDISKPVDQTIPMPIKEMEMSEPKAETVHTYIPESSAIVQPKEKRDNYTYIPSQKNVLNNIQNSNEKIKKYIPSQKTVNLAKTFDNSGLSQALRRADKAEQMAINILSGKFQY